MNKVLMKQMKMKMVSVKLIKIVDGVQMDCKDGGQGQFCKVSPAIAANSKMWKSSELICFDFSIQLYIVQLRSQRRRNLTYNSSPLSLLKIFCRRILAFTTSIVLTSLAWTSPVVGGDHKSKIRFSTVKDTFFRWPHSWLCSLASFFIHVEIEYAEHLEHGVILKSSPKF